MSAFKTILVLWHDADSGALPLHAAVSLGRRFGSHITALHVRADLSAVAPLGVEEMISQAEAQAARRADAAKEEFDRQCLQLRLQVVDAARPQAAPAAAAMPSARWLQAAGREEELVAWYGRFADLLILPRPGTEATGLPPATLDAALLATGRPLLLVPPGTEAFGQHIAIGWNGSVEAARSVGAALPLLQKAETVDVLVVQEGHAGPPGQAELIEYLTWHGVQGHLRQVDTSAFEAGDTLLAEVERRGLDLLIMGAYTHSRWREAVLGGVTRHVIHHATLPVLLSH